VLSPILFIIYVEELLRIMSLCRVCCYVGNMDCGSFACADDVILLAPTWYYAKKILFRCESVIKAYDVRFNSKDRKLLVYRYMAVRDILMSI